VRTADVFFPSSKVLLIDVELLHLQDGPITLATPRPLAFGDGHAAVRTLSNAAPPPLVEGKRDPRPGFDTPDGVHGRDY